MTKKYALKQFNQYKPMIEKAVWHYHKIYRLDREEIEGEAFTIFCEALETFDKSLSSFSTYLTGELKRLNGFCKKEYRKQNKDVVRIKQNNKTGYGVNIFCGRIDFNSVDFGYEVFDRIITKLDYEISLSNNAKEILEYICKREWEIIGSNYKPRYSHIQKVFRNKGWKYSDIKNGYEEIRKWWIGSNKDQFCMEA